MAVVELTPRFEEVRALGPHGFTRVSYADWGPRDASQVVICVHGLTRNCRDFDFLARRLAQRGLRIIVPDLPGRGRSEWASNPSDYATPLYLAATQAVIARHGAQAVAWIRHSLRATHRIGVAALPLRAHPPPLPH